MPFNILFADDSQMINEVMEFAFEEEDLKVDFALTFAQVLSKVKNKPYDLIVVDIDLNGFEILKRIKASEFNNHTEVFFLSENSEIEIKKRARAEGVTGWILKPFIPEKFVKTIKLYLQFYLKKSTAV